jgi:hypothetical protein
VITTVVKNKATRQVKTDTKPKIVDRGILCMSVGYADDDGRDMYRMWSTKTECVNII